MLSPVPSPPPHLVSVSPDSNILNDNGEPTNPHWRIVLHLSADFGHISLWLPLVFCFLGLLWSPTLSRSSCFFSWLTLAVVRCTGQVLYEISLRLSLSNVFLSWLDWGYGFFGESITEVKGVHPQGHHIVSGRTWFSHMASLGTLSVKAVFARFLHHKVIIFPFHASFLWSESLHPPHTGNGEIKFYFLMRGGIYL